MSIFQRLSRRASIAPEAPSPPQVTSAARVNETGGAYTAAAIFAGAIGPGTSGASLYSAQEIAYYNKPGAQTADLAAALNICVLSEEGSDQTFPVPAGVNVIAANNRDNVHLWGLNVILTDAFPQVKAKAQGRRLYNELDFNINSPDTQGTALLIGVNGTSQSKAGLNGIGFIGNQGRYFSGPLISVQDGVAVVFAEIGLQNSKIGVAANSQNLVWRTGNPDDPDRVTQAALPHGAPHEQMMIFASNRGAVHVGLSGDIEMAAGRDIKIGGQPAIASLQASIASLARQVSDLQGQLKSLMSKLTESPPQR
jgi:hypothetical protein